MLDCVSAESRARWGEMLQNTPVTLLFHVITAVIAWEKNYVFFTWNMKPAVIPQSLEEYHIQTHVILSPLLRVSRVS